MLNGVRGSGCGSPVARSCCTGDLAVHADRLAAVAVLAAEQQRVVGDRSARRRARTRSRRETAVLGREAVRHLELGDRVAVTHRIDSAPRIRPRRLQVRAGRRSASQLDRILGHGRLAGAPARPERGVDELLADRQAAGVAIGAGAADQQRLRPRRCSACWSGTRPASRRASVSPGLGVARSSSPTTSNRAPSTRMCVDLGRLRQVDSQPASSAPHGQAR